MEGTQCRNTHPKGNSSPKRPAGIVLNASRTDSKKQILGDRARWALCRCNPKGQNSDGLPKCEQPGKTLTRHQRLERLRHLLICAHL